MRHKWDPDALKRMYVCDTSRLEVHVVRIHVLS